MAKKRRTRATSTTTTTTPTIPTTPSAGSAVDQAGGTAEIAEHAETGTQEPQAADPGPRAITCPRCQHDRCPAINGTHTTTSEEVRRYRECRACGHRFATRHPRGGVEELR